MLHELKPWTTYKDNQGRHWVIVDLLPISWLEATSGDNIESVWIYQVGTDQKCKRVPAEDFRRYITENLMIKL